MRIIHLLLLTLTAPFSFAQELDIRWFDVEIYLFVRENSQTVETFPPYLGKEFTQNRIDLIKKQVQITQAELANLAQNCSSAEWAQDPADCNNRYQLNIAPPTWPKTIKGTILPKENLAFNPKQANDRTLLMPTADNTGVTATDIELSAQATITMPEDKGNQALPQDAYLLHGDNLEFGPHIDKIQASGEFKSIIHLAWRQPVGPKSWSVPFALYGGQDLGEQYYLDGKSKTSEQTLAMFDWGILTPKQHDNPLWQIDGNINIHLNHYLFIDTDLQLRRVAPLVERKKDSEGNWVEVSNNQYMYSLPIKQHRRVRSGQLHYFDHPHMGMLIQIRKLADNPTATKAVIED